jgi:hypothetical protein
MDRTELFDDPQEALRVALERDRAGLWTALPGIVVSSDLSRQTLTVQPAIQARVTLPDGSAQLVDLPLLLDVPVCWPRAGGFAVTLPVTAGDEVLVIFASRCIDSWWQSGGVQAPAEYRFHDLSDGFAILAPTSQPRVLADVNPAALELRNTAGTVKLALSDDGIEVTGPLTVDGILFQTHVHGGVETGGSNTGVPV